MSHPFPETPLFSDRSLSPIPAVLEINLATDSDEAALFTRCPTFQNPHCSSLLLPVDVIAAAKADQLSLPTERANAAALTPAMSPRRVLDISERERGKSMATTVRLQSELNQLREQIRGLEQSAGSSEVAKLMQRIRELERENKSLRESIEACRSDKRCIESHLSAASAEKESAAQELQRAEARLAHYQSSCSLEELKSLQQELAHLRLANESLRLSVSRQSEELMAAREHIKFLEIELLQTESACVTRTRLTEDTLRQSRELIAKTTQEISSAVGRLFDGEKAEMELKALQEKKEACLAGVRSTQDKKTRANFELELLFVESSIVLAEQRLKRGRKSDGVA